MFSTGEIERYTYIIGIIGSDRGSSYMRQAYARQKSSMILLITALIAIQFVARHFEEDLLVRAGHAYQRETDWHNEHPVV